MTGHGGQAVKPVACRRCGSCCADIGTPPFLPEEKSLPPPTVRDTIAAFIASDPNRCASGKPCYFWDEPTHMCRIYAYRLEICRDFVPGGEGCSQSAGGRNGRAGAATTDNQAAPTRRGGQAGRPGGAAEMAAGAIDHA